MGPIRGPSEFASKSYCVNDNVPQYVTRVVLCITKKSWSLMNRPFYSSEIVKNVSQRFENYKFHFHQVHGDSKDYLVVIYDANNV